jgi:Glycosyl transferase family 11
VIVSRLKGRLGNQMFQCAAGLGLAARHGTELVLDTSWMEQFRRGGGEVRYELDIFDMGVRVCPVWEVARVPNPRRAVYLLQRLRPSRRRFVHIVEEDTSTNAFQPAAVAAPDNTYLLGYWQFEDYFADQAEHVRRAFTFPEMSVDSERLAEEIRASPAVSIHVRRGDYTRHELLGFLDEAYYARAVETIARTAGEIYLFVFSDDPDWCRENLRFHHPTTIVARPLCEERAWEDMSLISLCRHNVVSNSTFSWWGAWLNPSPSKLVVAPERWSLGTKRIGDPIPRHWIRV